MQHSRWSTTLLVGVALASTGCGRANVAAPDPEPSTAIETIHDSVSLVPLGSCSAVEAHLKDELVLEANADADAAIRYAIANFGPQPTVAGPIGMDGAPPDVSPRAAGYEARSLAETGVEVPDQVKEDGERILLLQGNTLVALAVAAPEATRVLWSMKLEGGAHHMVRLGDRLAVFATVNLRALAALGGLPYPSARPAPPWWFAPNPPGVSCPSGSCSGQDTGVSITVIDVSGAPRILRQSYVGGELLSARRVGNAVHVVTSRALRGPERPTFARDVHWSTVEEEVAAFETLRRERMRSIAATPLDQWLPVRMERVGGGPLRVLDPGCADVHASTAPVKTGLSSITTVRLDDPAAPPAHTDVLTDIAVAFASAQSLHVLTTHRWLRPWTLQGGDPDHSYVYAFDLLADPYGPRPVAGGGFSGRAYTPSALGESGAFLRVAAVHGSIDEEFRRQPGRSEVLVLERRGATLVAAGSTGALGTRSIRFARFDKARAYLATSGTGDPIYAIDFSDSGAPRVVGEMRIPGTPAALQPLGPGHLVSVGPGAQETLDVDVVDVTDVAHARVSSVLSLTRPHAYAYANDDPRAFASLVSRGLLVLPVADTEGPLQPQRNLLRVLRVGATEGIVPVADIDHSDVGARPPYISAPAVQRSVVIGDHLFSISSAAVKVFRLDQLGTSRAVVPLPDPTSY